MPELRRWIVALIVLAFAGSSARGDCPLLKNLQDAEALHRTVAAAAGKATLSGALEWKVIRLVGPKFLADPSVGWIDALKTLQPELTAGEWAELGAYFAADAAYDASAASLKAAQDAYTREATRSAEAVRKAEAAYAEEVKFLDAERAAIQSMKVNSPEYLDRAAALADRLKKAYAKMNAELAPFVDCFADAAIFVADKNKRLKKIAALEADIAARRGVKPATLPTDATAAVTPADPNAPKLGATWRLVGQAEVTKPYGVLKSATASRIDFAFRHDDGTDVSGFVTCDKPPPAVIREGQRIDLAATAGGDPKAVASGSFWLEQVAHGGLLPGSANGCSVIPNYDSTRGTDCTRAAVSFYFYPYHSATECVILFGGGRFNGDEAKVTWRYRKE